jgi:hypothetical protein
MSRLEKTNYRIDVDKFDVKSPEIEILLKEIDKIRRRKLSDDQTINYVDFNGNLDKLLQPNNHLVIGRRGSGKTSLFIKAQEIINNKKDVLVMLDMQVYRKGLKENILLSILSKLCNSLMETLKNNHDWKPVNERKKLVKNYFLKHILYSTNLYKYKWDSQIIQIDILYFQLELIKQELKEISGWKGVQKFYLANTQNNKTTKQNLKKTSLKFGLKSNEFKQLTMSSTNTLSIENTIFFSKDIETKQECYYEISQEEVLKKMQFKIIDLIKEYRKTIKKSIYIFLDDFYQITIENQPFILNYLHEIHKETPRGSYSFKVNLVPSRFRLNNPGEKILSHRDDFSAITVDRDIIDLEGNKDTLTQIICGISPELKLNSTLINKLFNDNNIYDKLIIASGALPRMFLDVFEKSIRYSILENYTKIKNEILPHIIKDLKQSKDELVIEEADLSSENINILTKEIEDDVVNELKTSVILYPKSNFEKDENILNNLFNLGYIHRIKEEERVNGLLYIPLLIDMIFYHGDKNFPKGFRNIKFWKDRELQTCKVWNFKNDTIIPIIQEKN